MLAVVARVLRPVPAQPLPSELGTRHAARLAEAPQVDVVPRGAVGELAPLPAPGWQFDRLFWPEKWTEKKWPQKWPKLAFEKVI